MARLIPYIIIIASVLLHSCDHHRDGNEVNQFAISISTPELTVFEAPDEAPVNLSYSVYVRCAGGEWIDMHEYDAEVDGGAEVHGTYLDKPVHHMAFVSFDSDFSKDVEVKVVSHERAIEDVKIRPLGAGIDYKVYGDTILFSMTEPRKLSVEVNGDLHNNLMLFANAPEAERPDPDDPLVHYFGPGIHKIGGDGKGTLQIDRKEKVYIAGGAIVYGTISALGADSISITGRGILSGSLYTDHAYPHPHAKNLIALWGVKDATIEGITLLNSVMWNIHLYGCENMVCKNLKIMGWTINSDGIDPQCSSHILIDDVFVRNFDDCISIKMNYGETVFAFNAPSKSITVQNCIFWTDQGRSVLIGPESYTYDRSVYEDITIRNIDVLYNENFDVDWAKGVLAINLGDDAIARNITFEEIRVERLGLKTNLITLTMDKYTYNVSEAKRMENILFRNISLNPEQNHRNYIYGYDDFRVISGVHFENLVIGGKEIENAEQGWFDVNAYVEEITFLPGE